MGGRLHRYAIILTAGLLAATAWASNARDASAGTLEYSYHFFDTCPGSNGSISPTQMNAWWFGEIYYWGVAVYVRGAARNLPTGCFRPNAAWTSAVQQIGWGIMPIWLGRTCGQFSADPVADGINDAGGGAAPSAPNTMEDLSATGFPVNATVAIDIEGTGCNSAMAGYVNGWVWQMGQWSQGQTYTVVYGSAAGAISAINNAAGNPGMHEPYAIWAGCYTAAANASYGGNGSACPGDQVWNIPGTPNGNWCCDQRHHQWLSSLNGAAGGHYECYSRADYPQYGYAVFYVDSNAADSLISWGYSYSESNEINDGPIEDPGQGLAPPGANPNYQGTGWQTQC